MFGKEKTADIQAALELTDHLAEAIELLLSGCDLQAMLLNHRKETVPEESFDDVVKRILGDYRVRRALFDPFIQKALSTISNDPVQFHDYLQEENPMRNLFIVISQLIAEAQGDAS